MVTAATFSFVVGSVLAAAAPVPPPVAAASPPAVTGASDPAYLFTLGRLLAGEGQLAAARDALDAAVAGAPTDPYLRLELANVLLRAGQIEAAREQVERASSLDPESPDVLRATAQIQLMAADRDPRLANQAIATLERLRALAPEDVRSMVGLAQLYLRVQRSAEAVAVLQDVARHWPSHPIVNAMLVDALLEAGRPTEAEAALERMLAGDPLSLESRLQLADLQSRRGDHRAARATLDATPPEQAASTDLLRRRAFEEFRTGDAATALATTDALLALDATSVGGRYLRGIVLAALGRESEAVSLLSELSKEAPRSVDVAEALASIFERQGEIDQAAEVLSGLLARLPAASPLADRLRLRQAGMLASHGRFAAALEAVAPLREAKDAELRDQGLLLSSRLLEELGRAGEARELLAARIAAGETSPELVTRYAELLLAGGEREEGDRRLTALAQSGDGDAVLLAAQVYQRRGEFARAVPLLEAHLATHPEAVPLLYALGGSLERSGQHSAAAAAFQRPLALAPDFAPALNYLGYMWAERGENLTAALELIERAVAHDPNNGAYVDSLGWVLHRLGNHERALVELRRAATLVPDDPTISEHLGDVHRALGDLEQARGAYRRALDLAVGAEFETLAPQLQRKLDELD